MSRLNGAGPRCALACTPLLLLSTSALAQCDPAWLTADTLPGVDGEVDAITVWDPDGPGPAQPLIVIGGLFSAAGDATVSNIAAWDGVAWQPLGPGVNDYVLALAPHPSGDLYAAGLFTTAGGAPAARVARWDGAAWHALGAGVNRTVYSLAVLPSGEVIAGGAFDTAGGLPAPFIARWSPATASWSPLGPGFNDVVFSLAVRPTGELFAGGWFTASGGSTARSVARWTGSAWRGLGSGSWTGGVLAMTFGADGDLYAGGDFTMAGSIEANHVARWSFPAAAWTGLGPGIGDDLGDLVFTLAARPDGSIVAGGYLTDLLGTGLGHIGAWNGVEWTPLGTGIDGVAVFSLANLPGGDLAAGGLFTAAGGQPASSLARWGAPDAPFIITQPGDAVSCPGGTAQFTVSAIGATTYQWRLDDDPIPPAVNPTAQSPTLIISGVSSADAGLYDCLVAGPCGELSSDTAVLTFCAVDFTCDGLVDFSDYLEFLNMYASGHPDVDFNKDGLVDFADYLEFLTMYDAGC